MEKKKRKRNNGSSSNSKRQRFYLVQDEVVLESGTKRTVEDLEATYRQLGMNVVVYNEQQHESWKRRRTVDRQNTEYEEAAALDMEKQRLQQLQIAFLDPAKRRDIIAKSYEKLFREKKYI